MTDVRVFYSFGDRVGKPGIGATALHQVRTASRAGARIIVACSSCDADLPEAERVHEFMRVGGRRVPHRLLGRLRAMRLHDDRAAAMLRRSPSSFDVVHCWPLGALRTLLAARELGIPTVLERPSSNTRLVMKLVAEEAARLGLMMPRSHYSGDNRRSLHWQENEFALCDALLCPSGFVVSTFLDALVDPRRIIRHRYGCVVSRFTPGPQDREAGARPPRFLFVGECAPLKGLHLALEAWRRADGPGRSEFWICGRFVDGYRETLADALALDGVRLMGFVENVPEVMRQCDVLVLPSLAEGSAIVTYEARASGCVLLVSHASGAIGEADHGVLIHTAGDIARLAAHIRSVLDDPGERLRLRARSLATAAELDWSEGGESLVRAYRQAISVAGRR